MHEASVFRGGRGGECVCICMCVYIRSCMCVCTVDVDIFTVNLFSLYSQLVNNHEIKLTLIIQRQLQYYSISAAIVKIKYA